MKYSVILLFLIGLFVLSTPQVLADNAFCNISENLKIQEELIKDNIVLIEFLKLFPDAVLTRANYIDESNPEQTSMIWTAREVYSLSIHIWGFDENNPSDCFVPGGYRLNAPHLPEMVGLDYHKDPKVVLDQIKELKFKYAKGASLPASKEKPIEPSIYYKFERENGLRSGAQYSISNATVQNVSFDEQQQPILIFKLQEAGNGHMQIMIASGLLYPVNLEYQSKYIVLADRIETEFIQHSPIFLEIPFKEGTKEIRIVSKYSPSLPDQQDLVEKDDDNPTISIPSCSAAVLVTDNARCFIDEYPPCEEPSFEKNGLCIVEKISVCEKGNILKNNQCIFDAGHFRVDDPNFGTQNLIANHTIIPWNDYSEYTFEDDAIIIRDNLGGLGILETNTEYYVIQRADFEAENFGNKDTKVNATIGFAIRPGDQIIHPPRGENVTEEDHIEFNLQMLEQNEEFSKQRDVIGDSYDFVVDLENPFYIKFPFTIEESGQHTRQFYKKTHIFEGPASYGMGGLVVVDKFSKAVDANGICNNDEFRHIIKHDYSTMVCVDSQTISILKNRGWALN